MTNSKRQQHKVCFYKESKKLLFLIACDRRYHLRKKKQKDWLYTWRMESLFQEKIILIIGNPMIIGNIITMINIYKHTKQFNMRRKTLADLWRTYNTYIQCEFLSIFLFQNLKTNMELENWGIIFAINQMKTMMINITLNVRLDLHQNLLK